ncbi:MAG: hypothetical protein ACK5PP_02060 [Acidimicrobiales bacterium]
MTDSGTPVVSVTDYSGVVKRWFWILAIAAILGAVVGALAMRLQSTMYVSEAVVQITPLTAEIDQAADVSRQISMETELAVAGSERVAERASALRTAATELDAENYSSLEVSQEADTVEVDPASVATALEQLVVSAPDDSQILVFTATTDTADSAEALAQSSAVAYLDFRNDRVIQDRQATLERLNAREHELVGRLNEQQAAQAAQVQEQIAAGQESPPTTTNYADVAAVQELSSIGGTYANLATLADNPGVILTDADQPSDPEGLPFLAGPVIGALIGLVIAFTAAFLLDRSDDRLRSSRVELAALGVPMLGTAPVRAGRSAVAPELVGVGGGGGRGEQPARLFGSDTAAGDAYRRIQSTLAFSLEQTDKTVIVVAGVTEPAPPTSVAANLAATAARGGRRTLLVDADLRNAPLARHLGLEVDAGLSNVVFDGVGLQATVTPVRGVNNLWLLPAGTRRDRPAEVLRSQSLARLVAAVGADFDLVVVLAPPVLKVADAVDVARVCDGAVLVADGGTETRQAIADSVDQLRGVGAEIIGVIVADDHSSAR